jgi:hypothetical protein
MRTHSVNSSRLTLDRYVRMAGDPLPEGDARQRVGRIRTFQA